MTAVQADRGLARITAQADKQSWWSQWAPLSGVGFVVFFAASVVVSSPPADTESDQAWIANYTGTASQIGHLATGICLVLAAISLLTFLTVVWGRIAAARRPGTLHPLPLVAAGTSAACIAVGGVLMGGISGDLLVGGGPVPGADLLRFGNEMGFGMVALAGMSMAAVSIAGMSVQARSVGLFGKRMLVFSLVIAVLLLGSLAFAPIAGLFVWIVAALVVLMRTPFAGATS
jgi:hypothetical protein